MKTQLQTVYVAFDGTEFLDDEECVNYEIKLTEEIPIGVELRDIEGNVLPFTFFIENDFSSLYGIKFHCETEKEHFHRIINEEDPNLGGIDWEKDCLHYVYSADENRWFDAKEFYFNLVNLARAFKIKWGIDF